METLSRNHIISTALNRYEAEQVRAVARASDQTVSELVREILVQALAARISNVLFPRNQHDRP